MNRPLAVSRHRCCRLHDRLKTPPLSPLRERRLPGRGSCQFVGRWRRVPRIRCAHRDPTFEVSDNTGFELGPVPGHLQPGHFVSQNRQQAALGPACRERQSCRHPLPDAAPCDDPTPASPQPSWTSYDTHSNARPGPGEYRLEELDPSSAGPWINRISGGSFLRWFVGFRLCRTCRALLRLPPRGFPPVASQPSGPLTARLGNTPNPEQNTSTKPHHIPPGLVPRKTKLSTPASPAGYPIPLRPTRQMPGHPCRSDSIMASVTFSDPPAVHPPVPSCRRKSTHHSEEP
ncbi:MAG: hypothetical protein CM1200mP2_20840 [Planctomycetaceae bacterium]|nr:MAG: hypothetical protein CM1200mP2_20840 [Planctomycetaceae bacterium]